MDFTHLWAVARSRPGGPLKALAATLSCGVNEHRRTRRAADGFNPSRLQWNPVWTYRETLDTAQDLGQDQVLGISCLSKKNQHEI